MAHAIAKIPVQGVGIGYRREIAEQIFAAADKLDLVEIITEQFFDPITSDAELARLCASFKVLPHGVGLSIGSPILADQSYLRSVKRVVDQTAAPFYSEHLCMTRAPGIDLGHLAPLAFTSAVLASTVDHVQQIQDFLGKPLILENIAHLLKIGSGDMSEEAFFHELVERTGCGILLDITNINANAANFGTDAGEILGRMPLDRVVQVHLAGGYWAGGFFVDGHSHPVAEACWSLFRTLAEACPIKACLIERDDNLPEDISPLIAEVERVRGIISSSPSALRPPEGVSY